MSTDLTKLILQKLPDLKSQEFRLGLIVMQIMVDITEIGKKLGLSNVHITPTSKLRIAWFHGGKYHIEFQMFQGDLSMGFFKKMRVTPVLSISMIGDKTVVKARGGKAKRWVVVMNNDLNVLCKLKF